MKTRMFWTFPQRYKNEGLEKFRHAFIEYSNNIARDEKKNSRYIPRKTFPLSLSSPTPPRPSFDQNIHVINFNMNLIRIKRIFKPEDSPRLEFQRLTIIADVLYTGMKITGIEFFFFFIFPSPEPGSRVPIKEILFSLF